MAALKPYEETLAIRNENELVDLFLKTLVPTNRTYDFFVDWHKVRSNVERLKIEIALLGSVAGSRNPEEALRKLLVRYPESSKAIPILIAVRQRKFQVLENLETAEGYADFDFSKPELSASEIEHIVGFCTKTGITSLLASLQDLRGYITGVEVGLDTHARKNRSGRSMERLVETFVSRLAKLHPGLEVRTQQKFSALERIKGVAVPDRLRDRRFDMVVTLDGRPFNVETNFYSGTGSKPQEIVDAYINRQQELDEAGWKLIWVIDGYGWRGMENQVRMAFKDVDYVLNLEFVRRGVLSAVLSRQSTSAFEDSGLAAMTDIISMFQGGGGGRPKA